MGVDRLLWVLCVLFAVLSMYGAACQVRNPQFRQPCILMIAGGAVLIGAVAASLDGLLYDWLLALFGCTAICVAAMWNGKRCNNLHLKHHVLRIAFCALSVVCFYFY